MVLEILSNGFYLESREGRSLIGRKDISVANVMMYGTFDLSHIGCWGMYGGGAAGGGRAFCKMIERPLTRHTN